MNFARTAKALAITAAAAFALSGCIKLDMDMKVKADTKIDGTMIVAFNEEAMKSMEGMMEGLGDKNSKTPTTKAKSFEQQTKDGVKEAQAKLPKGSTAKLYKKDGWLGQEIKFSNVDANVALGAGLGAGATTGSTSSTDTLKVTKKGNTLELNGALDLGGGTGDTSGGDMSGLMGASKPELRIKFSFPGKVTSASKGGKISGNSVTWTPKFGEKLVLKAVANAS
jgi:hypothetical protein